ncbi:MAG: hypothetical protein H8E26_14145 [FCB group bacterium]|nr:hypothetical protein [FCB group bacterium]MBL7027425.1 hypothetical protein [Candidatus Neomarinimicrobiota bacterium]MBL7122593.1 hypothetical protein [Candidatus Neomarinimicrobiota bacterium]
MKLLAAFFDKTTTMGFSGGSTAAVAPYLDQVGELAQAGAQILGLVIAIVILMIRWKEFKKK